MMGGDMPHVAYRGEVPMLQDLIAGNLAMSYATGAQATQFIAAGRLKAIGVTGTSRLPNLANVPTLAEAGLDDPLLRAVGWIGFAVPSGDTEAGRAAPRARVRGSDETSGRSRQKTTRTRRCSTVGFSAPGPRAGSVSPTRQ